MGDTPEQIIMAWAKWIDQQKDNEQIDFKQMNLGSYQ